MSPVWCVLFKKEFESSLHLFLNYDYTIWVWESVLTGIYHCYQHPFNWNNIFSKWDTLYKGSFKDKPLYKRILVDPSQQVWEGSFSTPGEPSKLPMNGVLAYFLIIG
jgi:hypothetical protein